MTFDGISQPDMSTISNNQILDWIHLDWILLDPMNLFFYLMIEASEMITRHQPCTAHALRNNKHPAPILLVIFAECDDFREMQPALTATVRKLANQSHTKLEIVNDRAKLFADCPLLFSDILSPPLLSCILWMSFKVSDCFMHDLFENTMNFSYLPFQFF